MSIEVKDIIEHTVKDLEREIASLNQFMNHANYENTDVTLAIIYRISYLEKQINSLHTPKVDIDTL